MTEDPSGSVSNVVAQEDDVVWREDRIKHVNPGARACLMCTCVYLPTCDDGRRLAPDLVLIYILAVVQFPFHQNPGAGGQKLE